MRSDIRIKRTARPPERKPPRPVPARNSSPAAKPVQVVPRPAAKQPTGVPAAPPKAPPVAEEVVIPEGPPDELYVAQPVARKIEIALPGFINRRSVLGILTVVTLIAIGFRAQAQGREIKTDITGNVEAAQTAVKSARDSLKAGDYAAAKQEFQVAQTALHAANQNLADHGQVNLLAPGQTSGSIDSGTQLLASAELAARSGVDLTDDMAHIQADLAARHNDYYQLGSVLATRVPELDQHVKDATRRVELLNLSVQAAEHNGGQLKAAVDPLAKELPGMVTQMQKVSQVTGVLPQLLGMDRFKQYLFWFENPGELRPTGGFVGTFGRMTLDSGNLKELSVDSIYTAANQTDPKAVVKDPPQPYVRFYGLGQKSTWSLQDSNWSPDFPTSARKFQDLYEHSGGPTTDGVVAITLNPILDILRVTGPIEMPEYGYTLSADNFQQLIQADQQTKSALGDTDPKRILRDFLPKLLGRIGQANPAQRQQIFDTIAKAAGEREIQAFFNDPQLEQLPELTRTDSRLKHGANTLSVIDTNIGGRKSSADMKVRVDEELRIDEKGRANVRLIISRRHTAQTTQDANYNFTRVFLPKGAKLTRSDGFEDYAPVTTDTEDGSTVVGGWTSTPPNAERISTIEYQLPKRFSLGSGSLPIVYQKQAGTAVTYNLEAVLPKGYRWSNVPQGSFDGDTARLTHAATNDLDITASFKKD